MNKAALRLVSVVCAVITLGLVAALLAQDGLFSDDPGAPGHPDGLTTLALVLAILAFLDWSAPAGRMQRRGWLKKAW